MRRIPEPAPEEVFVVVDHDGMPWDSWRCREHAELDLEEAEARDQQKEEYRRFGPYRIVRYVLPSLVALVLVLVGCSAPASSPADPAPPICHGPRVFLFSPAAVDWRDSIAWAFDRWRADVPELGAATYAVLVGEPVAPAECVTPVDVVALEDAGAFGESRAGALLLSPKASTLTMDGRRALALHELGHLVFRLGHSTDRASAMWRVIQHAPQPLTSADVAAARAALEAEP